jgi:hypothetical protein
MYSPKYRYAATKEWTWMVNKINGLFKSPRPITLELKIDRGFHYSRTGYLGGRLWNVRDARETICRLVTMWLKSKPGHELSISVDQFIENRAVWDEMAKSQPKIMTILEEVDGITSNAIYQGSGSVRAQDALLAELESCVLSSSGPSAISSDMADRVCLLKEWVAQGLL